MQKRELPAWLIIDGMDQINPIWIVGWVIQLKVEKILWHHIFIFKKTHTK